MGESILGLPNRFKIINTLLESTYNPNHVLSAYQGYKLSTDYVNRSGGLNFAMTGNLYTQSLLPTPDINKPKDIGTETYKYRNIYAECVVAESLKGSSDSAVKLSTARTIELTGSVTGKVTTDLSGNVIMSTTTNHNHDSLYLKLSGGTLSGGLMIGGTTCPSATELYTLGTSSLIWKTIYAKTVNAQSFTGNAATASKLANVRNIVISLTPSSSTSNNSGSASFDGSSDISINVNVPYLPISGGTLQGNLILSRGSIIPQENKSQDIGDSDHKWNSIYVDTVRSNSLYGNLIGNSDTASKLYTSRKITVALSNSDNVSNNSGSASFDGSSDISINVNAPYLPISGGTLQGNLTPKLNDIYYIGNSSYKFKGIYATSLYGNADTASKRANARNITVRLVPSTVPINDYGAAPFDGSSNININVNAPYLPINGGTLYGNLDLLNGNITPYVNKSNTIGDSEHQWKDIYVENVNASSLYGNLSGNADTASKLANTRTLTIGSKGKTFDGSSDVSWSLSDIGAAEASVVSNIGVMTTQKRFEYSYSSGNTDEIGDMGDIEFYGDSNVAHTVDPGTYIIISKIVGAFLPRSVTVGIAYGNAVNSVSLDDRTLVTIPSTPMVVDPDGTTVRARTKTFTHRISSPTMRTFTTKTVIVPYASIQASPNWTGNTFYYTMSLQCIRIK